MGIHRKLIWNTADICFIFNQQFPLRRHPNCLSESSAALATWARESQELGQTQLQKQKNLTWSELKELAKKEQEQPSPKKKDQAGNDKGWHEKGGGKGGSYSDAARGKGKKSGKSGKGKGAGSPKGGKKRW